MTDDMQGILAEAKKNKFSGIKDSLSEDGKFPCCCGRPLTRHIHQSLIILNVIQDFISRKSNTRLTESLLVFPKFCKGFRPNCLF